VEASPRLNRVLIATRDAEVAISWKSRAALLHAAARLPTGSGIRAAFEAVGASRPVELTTAQKAGLLAAIKELASRSPREYECSPDLLGLRYALVTDLRTSHQP